VILAFAVRTASVLVGICSGCGAFVTLPTVGIIGVVKIQARDMGCVLIGPVVGLILGILDNSFLPSSFKTKPGTWRYLTRMSRLTKLHRHIDSKQLITCGPLSDQARWQCTCEIFANEQYCSSIGGVLRHGGSITAPSRHLPVTESVALPPDLRRSIMSRPKTTEQKWHEQSEAAKEEAAKLPYGKLKNQLLQKARQLNTASQMSQWLSSPGLQAPR